MRVKEAVKLEGGKETAETLLTSALSAVLNSAVMKLSLCITLLVPLSQECFGTPVNAGHRCCSAAAETWDPWARPCLSAGWVGFPPLCQHPQV